VRVLALDTATEGCSVALLVGDELTERFTELRQGHAEQVLAMVEALLAEAQVSLSMLDGIAASVGPGSFTGVRISVAVAQGLAFGANLRVASVTTLEALAYQVMRNGAAAHALACLDARMGEVYWGGFTADPGRGLLPSTNPQVGPPDSVVLPGPGVYRGIGRGFAAYPALSALPGVVVDAADSHALPHAREFALLGALRLAAREGLDPADLCPLYVRDKVALTEAERRQKQAQ
jgi:tRNA threonylcarbamoyladenosine biosynthesis protein TsaB